MESANERLGGALAAVAGGAGPGAGSGTAEALVAAVVAGTVLTVAVALMSLFAMGADVSVVVVVTGAAVVVAVVAVVEDVVVEVAVGAGRVACFGDGVLKGWKAETASSSPSESLHPMLLAICACLAQRHPMRFQGQALQSTGAYLRRLSSLNHSSRSAAVLALSV